MPDVSSLSRNDAEIVLSIDPLLQPIALAHRAAVRRRGIPLTFTSGKRSLAKQRELFDTLPPGQAATPGTSLHEIGFAYDVAGATNAAQWDIVGAEGEALGLEWGGRFRTVREPWHFQAPQSRTELRALQVARTVALVVVLIVGIVFVRAQTNG